MVNSRDHVALPVLQVVIPSKVADVNGEVNGHDFSLDFTGFTSHLHAYSKNQCFHYSTNVPMISTHLNTFLLSSFWAPGRFYRLEYRRGGQSFVRVEPLRHVVPWDSSHVEKFTRPVSMPSRNAGVGTDLSSTFSKKFLSSWLQCNVFGGELSIGLST